MPITAATTHWRNAVVLVPSVLALGCGRELKLASRLPAPTGLYQTFVLDFSLLVDGSSSTYSAAVTFNSGGQTGAPQALPAGDTLTLNGANMTAVDDGTPSYSLSGPMTAETMTFVWVDDGVRRTNKFSLATFSPGTPSSIQKSVGGNITFDSAPAGATIDAQITDGSVTSSDVILSPGATTLQIPASALTALTAGSNGTLRITSTVSSALQEATDVGGSAQVMTSQISAIAIAP